jgi:protoheme ferro-lyase
MPKPRFTTITIDVETAEKLKKMAEAEATNPAGFLRQWLNDPAFLEIWLKKFEKRLQEIKEEIKKSSEKSYSGATERRGKSLNL